MADTASMPLANTEIPLRVRARTEGGDALLVLELSGALDFESVPRLREAAAVRSPGSALVLDLSGLDFVDSSGVSAILRIQTRSQSEKPRWRFAVVPGPPSVQRTFDISGATLLLRFVTAPGQLLS